MDGEINEITNCISLIILSLLLHLISLYYTDLYAMLYIILFMKSVEHAICVGWYYGSFFQHHNILEVVSVYAGYIDAKNVVVMRVYCTLIAIYIDDFSSICSAIIMSVLSMQGKISLCKNAMSDLASHPYRDKLHLAFI